MLFRLEDFWNKHNITDFSSHPTHKKLKENLAWTFRERKPQKQEKEIFSKVLNEFVASHREKARGEKKMSVNGFDELPQT